jgi:hypothetical protein
MQTFRFTMFHPHRLDQLTLDAVSHHSTMKSVRLGRGDKVVGCGDYDTGWREGWGDFSADRVGAMEGDVQQMTGHIHTQKEE